MYQILTVPCIGDISPLKFNAVVASLAGLAFFSGWWLMISLIAENQIRYYDFFPGLFGTAALVVINIIPTGFVQEPQLYSYNTRCGLLAVRTCLLIGFMVAFGALISACYILFNDYILNHEELNKWPGYGMFLHNLLIFCAGVLLKFRTSLENY